jgi:hypothetical protein
VGSTFHQVRKTDEQEFRIFTHEIRFTFEEIGDGTRVTDEWKLDSGRPALLERLGAGRIRSAVLENLGKLKVLLETGEVRLQDGRRATL